MGDFNCVKSPEEKQLGVTPTWYELKDFVDCCAALGLLDVPTTGCYYTWYSNNESNPVWCKLDQVLHNNEWLEAGLHCGAHFNPSRCLSNHSPGIVTIFDNTPTKPKPFRFFNMWAEHPKFLSTVEQRWNLHVEGTPQFILCKRLKALKAELKAFNVQHYSHISTRAKEADLALQDAQNQLENNPGNVRLRESLGEPRFTTLKRGTETRNSSTIWEVTAMEVKDAIFNINDNKAPGPDGYSSCFFKKTWNVVGDQVCRAVLDFFRNGRMLRQLNHTVIALVPKSEHSSSVADYRSISCCNVIY
ncbi:UNVERIFIED_CONTAM: hypothetical protein Sindi_0424900 [Sesamum indicum]